MIFGFGFEFGFGFKLQRLLSNIACVRSFGFGFRIRIQIQISNSDSWLISGFGLEFGFASGSSDSDSDGYTDGESRDIEEARRAAMLEMEGEQQIIIPGFDIWRNKNTPTIHLVKRFEDHSVGCKKQMRPEGQTNYELLKCLPDRQVKWRKFCRKASSL